MVAYILLLLVSALAGAQGLKTCIYCRANPTYRLACHLGRETGDDYEVLYDTAGGGTSRTPPTRERGWIFPCSRYLYGSHNFICSDTLAKSAADPVFYFKRSTSEKPNIDVKLDCP